MLYFLNPRSSTLIKEQRLYARVSGDRRKKSNKLNSGRVKAAEFVPAIILFSSILFLLWLRIENISLQYDLESEHSRSLELDSQLRQVRLDYAYATRHNYLKEKAESELGLVSRNSQEVRILRK